MFNSAVPDPGISTGSRKLANGGRIADNGLMTRLSRWIILICLLAASLGAAERPPNIVFILTDDLGINDLACYGRDDHSTPNLDKLASEGARFTSAYCAQPICSPSRAALMTGKAPARLHITTFLPGRANASSQMLLHPQIEQRLSLEELTIAERLKSKGYRCGYVGKWHLGGRGFLPPDQGFEYFHPGRANTEPSDREGGKGEYDLTAKAIEFIERNREKPFFLLISHNTPHISYRARTSLVAKHQEAFEPVYAAVIETLDDSIGKLLGKIDELKLRENTLVIFTSDNGGLHVPELDHKRITHLGPFRAGKGYVYEGGLRIPLIVRWPGKIREGSVVEQPVVNTDWLPTFMEITGIAGDETLDGENILPILEGRKMDQDRRFFWHFPHYNNQGGRPSGAVRAGDWKLVEHYDTGSLELYDLARDPGEKQNLAEAEPERATQMKKALADWREQVGAQENTRNPEFDSALFRKLYIDFDPSKFDPLAATDEQWQAAQEWRGLMDEVVRRR